MQNKNCVYKTVLVLLLIIPNIKVSGCENDFFPKLWGKPASNLVYLGMWTHHLYHYNKLELYRNDLAMIVYKSVFAGTFMNCYGDRTYILGIQRYLLENKFNYCFNSKLGYRAGLMYGYDEQLFPLAGKIKILPCAQIIYDLSWKNIGFELSYTGIVISGGFYFSF